jgi:hypothetical protein
MLAGHGCLDDAPGASSAQSFVYLSHDASILPPKSDEMRVVRKGGVSTGITGEELAFWLAQLKCRTCLILDTCHSGAAPTAQQLGDQASLSIGPVVLAACARHEQSFQLAELGGGLFTKAMVQAWQEEKASPLTVGQWLQAVRSHTEALRSQHLPGKQQTPQVVPSRAFLDVEAFLLSQSN